ncbi:MAG TPA: DUF5611 family protein [Thermoplasmata archaeon]|nr:DUF5611 family protein [Thermoplasmata archaeon]
MQRYPVRANHRTNLAPEALARILTDCFGSATVDGETVSASFGAIVRLSARGDGKELAVEVSMNPKVADDVARDTIGRYNRFLESVTGFNAKERARRLRKSATEAPAGA